MGQDRSHCLGCFRTIPEIKAWSQAGGAQRLAIWAQLLERAGVPFALPHAQSEALAKKTAQQA